VCGFSLEKIPQLVTQQSSEPEQLLSDEFAEKLQERKQKIEHLLSMTGLGFTVVAALSLLSGLIYLMIGGNIPLIPGVIILIMLLGGMVAGSLAIYSESLKKTLSGRSSLRSSTLPKPATMSTPSLEAYPGPPISVTERTTTLLEKVEPVKKDKS
jgi:hypothetical protein